MIRPRRHPPAYIASLETLARRWGAGTWTGTNGALAAALFHALEDRAAILADLDNPGSLPMPDRTAPPANGLTGADLEAAWLGFSEAHRQRWAADPGTGRPEPAEPATPGRPPSEALLLEAAAIVADRRKSYGPCADHFRITVGLLNAAFAAKLRARLAAGLEPFELTDWPLVMALDKVARYMGPGRSPDCAIDLAGYAGTLRECEREAPRATD